MHKKSMKILNDILIIKFYKKEGLNLVFFVLISDIFPEICDNYYECNRKYHK